MKIGFIGTGVMGTGIVNNLLHAGHQVTVYNRTQSKAANVISHGAVWADTPANVARVSEITFTMVGYPKDVEDVWMREDGIFAGVKTGAILVDMTTSTPKLAEKLAKKGEKLGVQVIDAPVSGGDTGAENGTLSIMVGGSSTTFDQVLPIFKDIGQQIVLAGSAGKGQHMKMSNNIGVAATVITMAESMVYAKAAGLNMTDAYNVWRSGAAGSWSVTNYMPRVMAGDFSAGFYVKHLLKDLRIALDSAADMQLDLPGAQLAEQLFAKLSQTHGEEGVQAIVKLWSEFQ
ncbi:NAD(P)-dependent oxidoreductase [Leuconostoc gelidum subsp. gasicomitatum]|uniref:NAD(P)-dependent oxidoreductase n=1 Tax=Leuconostoc gasicomitatum TaxID=115778 RepID=UPI0007448EB0|nr:NAD(P)-dependent oxidoreductase [Leuconostoc gasicomitatum]MBZ5953204.1 NAD(P)-dependent oxidoreductase [Leuconostoc gasicomitatum]MBZ5988538.1 NAD(P)-dependent oxidoreductase [Leuconostoc gasicomitatum]MBZ5990803.1 NAD(P)-dependent oxidoreductase [Leuconostoc gasicomitatum]CUR62710.1 Possible 2-hydroxy-3-oxopropionate reductase [Leuconostoc gasicomitatum KG16-1]